MANSRFSFGPLSAEFPASNFPELKIGGQRRPVLAFDASTVEGCFWTGIAPQGLTGTLTLIVTYRMASATSGKVDFEGSVEAITDGDAFDTDAGSSFDSVNAADETVPGTAGYISQLSITLTNADSIAAADYFRIKLERDANDGSDDTATGDCEVLGVELRDAA